MDAEMNRLDLEIRALFTGVALYLNRRLRSQGVHDLNTVNHCTQIVDYCT